MQATAQLSLKIRKLYSEPISDADALDASRRLVSFFKILADVDAKKKKEKNDNLGSKDTTNPTK